VEYFHGQVRELLTGYGKLDIMWFDFSYGEMSGEKWEATKLLNMIRKLAPDLITDTRLFAGGEGMKAEEMLQYGDFLSPEQILPPRGMTDSEGNPVPWEACVTLNNSWGYHAYDRDFKSPKDVVRALVECVSKSGNLLLNMGPDAKGNFPEEGVAVLKEVGKWMAKNGDSIYGCGYAGLEKPEWGRYTMKEGRLYAHILERGIGPIRMQGLAEKVKAARRLSDHAEIKLDRPWNASNAKEDLFVSFPGYALPDEKDTVVELIL